MRKKNTHTQQTICNVCPCNVWEIRWHNQYYHHMEFYYLNRESGKSPLFFYIYFSQFLKCKHIQHVVDLVYFFSASISILASKLFCILWNIAMGYREMNRFYWIMCNGMFYYEISSYFIFLFLYLKICYFENIPKWYSQTEVIACLFKQKKKNEHSTIESSNYLLNKRIE